MIIKFKRIGAEIFDDQGNPIEGVRKITVTAEAMRGTKVEIESYLTAGAIEADTEKEGIHVSIRRECPYCGNVTCESHF